MIILFIALIIKASEATDDHHGVTPYLAHVDELNVAPFDDAQHRGPRFYDYNSDSSSNSKTDSDSEEEDSSSVSSDSSDDDESTSASSFETNESKYATRVFRTCRPCPHDMMKKHKNIGIKWICGGYQRARRSFKSRCMMKYRNCEDGTMFVKLYDHRCKNDTYHGNHWFYVYKT